MIEVEDIKELLGYADMRSLKTFCEANHIPLLRLGRKIYTIAKFLQVIVFTQLKINYPGAEEAMRTIEYDNPEFTEFIQTSLNPPKKTREKFNLKAKNSPAVEKLLKKLN